MNVSTVVTSKVPLMRQRILTETERKEIEAFLAGKKSSTIIRMLIFKVKYGKVTMPDYSVVFIKI